MTLKTRVNRWLCRLRGGHQPYCDKEDNVMLCELCDAFTPAEYFYSLPEGVPVEWFFPDREVFR